MGGIAASYLVERLDIAEDRHGNLVKTANGVAQVVLGDQGVGDRALRQAGVLHTKHQRGVYRPKDIVRHELSLLSKGLAAALAQVHYHPDELYAEGRLEGHHDADLSGDLLGSCGRHLQFVAGQGLVFDHAGEKRVQRGLQGGADAHVVQPAEVGIGRGADTVLRKVHDPARRDGGEGRSFTFGGDAFEDPEAVALDDGEDAAPDELPPFAPVEPGGQPGNVERLVGQAGLHRNGGDQTRDRSGGVCGRKYRPARVPQARRNEYHAVVGHAVPEEIRGALPRRADDADALEVGLLGGVQVAEESRAHCPRVLPGQDNDVDEPVRERFQAERVFVPTGFGAVAPWHVHAGTEIRVDARPWKVYPVVIVGLGRDEGRRTVDLQREQVAVGHGVPLDH